MVRPLLGVILLGTMLASAGQERGGATVVVCFDKPERLKWIDKNDCIEDSRRQKVCRLPDKLTEPCPRVDYLAKKCGTLGKPYYIQQIEVLDLYEAKMGRSMSGLSPELVEIDRFETVEDYLKRLSKRMAPYIQPLSQLLEHGRKFVNSRTILSARAGLPPVVDLGIAPLPDPKKCVFSNLIQQQDFGTRIHFIQDERLMHHPLHEKMSEAVAWGHEMVYSYLRSYKDHKTSMGARKAMTFLITKQPEYFVGDVVDSLLSHGVLPLVEPKSPDGFLADGRQERQFSTFEIELAQALNLFFDVFELEYSPLEHPEYPIARAIKAFWPQFLKIQNWTPELLDAARDHLFNTMILTFDPSMMGYTQHLMRHFIPREGRRKLTTEFFKNLSLKNNIKIR